MLRTKRFGAIAIAYVVILILGTIGGILIGSTLVSPIETVIEVEKPSKCL